MQLQVVFAATLLSGWTCALAQAPAGISFDLQAFIDKQLQAGNQRIIVPPGRYRVTPKNQQHLVLRNLKDIQIIADGVEMICAETTRAMTISRCTNVTVRGLVIDYDPLPFTQGYITAMSADKIVHEVELFDGYPPAEAARNFKYEIFRPDTRTLRCDDHYPKKVEAVDSRHLRITNPVGSANEPEQVGDLIVIGAEYAPHGSAGHAIVCDGNVNVRLENIDLFASNCFGFLETNCDGSVYYRCRIERRPAATDPVKRADPRLRSLDADAFHSKHAVKGPSYIECVARFMGDDCINICGDYHMVMSSQGKDLRVLAKGSMNIQVGDPVELVQYDGRRLPDAKAVAIQPAGNIRDEERAFLLKQRMNESLRTAKGALNRAYTITLDRDVEIPIGGVICSDAPCWQRICRERLRLWLQPLPRHSHQSEPWRDQREPAGRLLDVGHPRRARILVAGGRQQQRPEDRRQHHHRLRPDGHRHRSRRRQRQDRAGRAHRNIAIIGNTVIGCPLPNIHVASTDGLRVENNKSQSPKLGGPSRQPSAATQPVRTENCENVTIRGNASK